MRKRPKLFTEVGGKIEIDVVGHRINSSLLTVCAASRADLRF
jgi:hypothetical protein